MLIFRYTFVYLTLAVDREHVPDILSAHGMCSHHEWTSYRNALGYRAADGSPLWLGSSDDDGALDTPRVRAWNSTSVSWPNIFMNFDGSQGFYCLPYQRVPFLFYLRVLGASVAPDFV